MTAFCLRLPVAAGNDVCFTFGLVHSVVTFGLVPEVSLQVPVQEMDQYLRLMVQIMGHQPQNRPFLQLMVHKMGHQPH